MKKKSMIIGAACIAAVVTVGGGLAVSAHGNGIMIFHGEDGQEIKVIMSEQTETDMDDTDKDTFTSKYHVGQITYENGYKQKVIGISEEGAILLQNLDEVDE